MIKRHVLIALFSFVTLFSFAQKEKKRAGIIYFKAEQPTVNPDVKKQKPFTYTDNGAIEKALHTSGKTKILYLPEGVYTIKKNISFFTSGLSIQGAGAGKTVVQFDSFFEGNEALFQSNGQSDITIRGITFTGNKKQIKAVLEFNSFPNRCSNIKILNCSFTNLWVEQAINFGGTGMNETHSLDHVLIDSCRFFNIYNPSFRIVTNDTDPKCVAVNLQQTTLRAEIKHCTFKNISGDGIFGWGWSRTNTTPNPLYGNWNIHHNYFENCWMCVEINGNALGNDLLIHDNTMRCSTRNGGFLISVDGNRAKIIHNNLYNIDRCLIEYTAVKGEVAYNTGLITTSANCIGGAAPSEKLLRIDCIEMYGYDNYIHHNSFTLERTNAGALSPQEFNGIKIIGKTTDPLDQPLEYKGIKDYSAYWNIAHNTVTGFTHKAIDATNEKIRNVFIHDNIFSSRYEQTTPVEIYGYNWRVINNTFDLRESGKNRGNIFGIFYLQKDKTHSVVSGNHIVGKNWNGNFNDNL